MISSGAASEPVASDGDAKQISEAEASSQSISPSSMSDPEATALQELRVTSSTSVSAMVSANAAVSLVKSILQIRTDAVIAFILCFFLLIFSPCY